MQVAWWGLISASILASERRTGLAMPKMKSAEIWDPRSSPVSAFPEMLCQGSWPAERRFSASENGWRKLSPVEWGRLGSKFSWLVMSFVQRQQDLCSKKGPFFLPMFWQFALASFSLNWWSLCWNCNVFFSRLQSNGFHQNLEMCISAVWRMHWFCFEEKLCDMAHVPSHATKAARQTDKVRVSAIPASNWTRSAASEISFRDFNCSTGIWCFKWLCSFRCQILLPSAFCGIFASKEIDLPTQQRGRWSKGLRRGGYSNCRTNFWNNFSCSFL